MYIVSSCFFNFLFFFYAYLSRYIVLLSLYCNLEYGLQKFNKIYLLTYLVTYLLTYLLTYYYIMAHPLIGAVLRNGSVRPYLSVPLRSMSPERNDLSKVKFGSIVRFRACK